MPKISLIRLKRNSEFYLKNMKYNWFLQIKKIFFESIEQENVLVNELLHYWKTREYCLTCIKSFDLKKILTKNLY